MAWNEPGGSRGQDPWGNRNNDQGPPDLDEIMKKVQARLSGLFGGKGPGAGRPGGRGASSLGISLIALIVLAVWALSGIYIINEGKQGVVLRFGAFDRIEGPGPHWHPRFIERVEVVDAEQVRSVTIGQVTSESLMLTQDENIIDIEFAIQYRVKDARDFLFNVRDPDTTLRDASESAMREIVGKSLMDFVLTEGRAEVAARAQQLVQEQLDRYRAGLVVTRLNMQDAQPPEQVQPAFLDAINAREDEQRLINEAQAYANDILPRARGAAARIVQEANAFREETVARAEGDASRFLNLLGAYQQAPDVTRERLYLEAMESILDRSNKVMVDIQPGSSLIYLPLDRIMDRQVAGAAGPEAAATNSAPAEQKAPSTRDRVRTREVR